MKNKKREIKFFDIYFQDNLWVVFLLYKWLLLYLPVINQPVHSKRTWKRYHPMRLRTKHKSSLPRCQRALSHLELFDLKSETVRHKLSPISVSATEGNCSWVWGFIIHWWMSFLILLNCTHIDWKMRKIYLQTKNESWVKMYWLFCYKIWNVYHLPFFKWSVSIV